MAAASACGIGPATTFSLGVVSNVMTAAAAAAAKMALNGYLLGFMAFPLRGDAGNVRRLTMGRGDRPKGSTD